MALLLLKLVLAKRTLKQIVLCHVPHITSTDHLFRGEPICVELTKVLIVLRHLIHTVEAQDLLFVYVLLTYYVIRGLNRIFETYQSLILTHIAHYTSVFHARNLLGIRLERIFVKLTTLEGV